MLKLPEQIVHTVVAYIKPMMVGRLINIPSGNSTEQDCQIATECSFENVSFYQAIL